MNLASHKIDECRQMMSIKRMKNYNQTGLQHQTVNLNVTVKLNVTAKLKLESFDGT